jgi:glycosyltransferase involved in cell wall biosynthesis
MPRSNESHPRVLFLTSSAFNRVTGGGVTFSNLFAGWPEERIATVHNDPVPVSTNVCSRYFPLTRAEVHKCGPLRLLERTAGPVAGAGGSGKAHAGIVTRALRAAKAILFGNALPDAGELTSRLEEWVAEFRPQVLYTILGTNAMMDLADALRRRFGIALVVHMMDDWPAVAYRGGLLSWIARRRMDRSLRQLFAVAKARLCIGDEMAREYENRYGAPFLPFQNPVDTEKWGHLAKVDATIRGTVKLLYVGSVLPDAQLASLMDCCLAVKKLRQEGMDIVFDIYSPTFQTDPVRDCLGIDPAIRMHDAVTVDEDFFRQLGTADILLLPVNFDDYTVRYIRLSMPTKIPAYLCSGTPILVYAPPNVAQAQYAQESGWGHVVSKKGVQHLMSGIRRLVADAGLRERLLRSARQAAVKNHDVHSVRARFQRTLDDSCVTSLRPAN